MRSTLVLGLGLAAALFAPTAAADAPRHAFGGSVLVRAEGVRDDLLAPIGTGGWGGSLALRYAGAFGGGAFRADLAAGAAYLTDRFDTAALAIAHSLRVRHAVVVDGGPWHLAVGPALGWETDLHYLDGWDDAHGYWLTDRWLGVTTAAWHALGDAFRVDLEAELALVGLESRPASRRYQKQDALTDPGFFFEHVQRDPRAAWLGDFQRARVAIDLWGSRSRTPIPAGWALGAELRLARADHPLVVVVEGALRFTFMWGFP